MKSIFRSHTLVVVFAGSMFGGCGGEAPTDEDVDTQEQPAGTAPGYCQDLFVAGYTAYEHHRIDLMAYAWEVFANECWAECRYHPQYPEVRAILRTLGSGTVIRCDDGDDEPVLRCGSHSCADASQDQWNAFFADFYSHLPSPPPPEPPAEPPAEPPTSGYSCPDGWRCDGSPVTGGPDEAVCGTDGQVWVCTPSSWQPTGSPCSC